MPSCEYCLNSCTEYPATHSDSVACMFPGLSGGLGGGLGGGADTPGGNGDGSGGLGGLGGGLGGGAHAEVLPPYSAVTCVGVSS
jgi:hypothetical protein